MTALSYNKINKNNSRPQIKCPHCKSTNLKIRTSEQRHPLLKEIWLTCPNLFCGFTCRGHIEITHTISPSASPDPEIYIPTLLQLQAANDDMREWVRHDDDYFYDSMFYVGSFRLLDLGQSSSSIYDLFSYGDLYWSTKATNFIRLNFIKNYVVIYSLFQFV